MQSFKSYLTESEIKPLHKVLNPSQMKALRKHPDFHYISGDYGSKIFAKYGPRHSPGLNHFIIANGDPKFRMDIAMTPRGKMYSHEIHKRSDEGWDFIKGGQGSKD